MTLIQSYKVAHKTTLLAAIALVGLMELAVAGGRTPASIRQIVDTEETNSVQEVEDDADQRQLNNVSVEDRTRLRRDLDTYSRSLDPVHGQIEGNRILMRKRLQERFFAADKDNDNALSRIEAAEMMPQIARHFSQVDLNSDELITMDELAVAQTKAIERQRAEEAQLEEMEKAELKKAEQANKAKTKQAESTRKRAL